MLADSLVGTCFGLGIKAVALITSMDAPLGRAVGNSVEVAEAISCLNEKGPEDLKELVCEQGKVRVLPFLQVSGSRVFKVDNVNLSR